jgi:hypothetical protein
LSIFEMELESKFEEISMGWIRYNLLKILGISKLDEIWLANSLLHLMAKKKEFPSKGDQKFEFLVREEFGLIS